MTSETFSNVAAVDPELGELRGASDEKKIDLLADTLALYLSQGQELIALPMEGTIMVIRKERKQAVH